MTEQNFIKISDSFFVDADYRQAFSDIGLTSIDSVFSFDRGQNLAKENLAAHRSRLQFEIHSPQTTLFLKRYKNTPPLAQLKNWLSHRRRISLACCDIEPAKKLAAIGINTAKTIAFGRQNGLLFEKRSFSITKKIPNAESLEKKLPTCFNGPATVENLKLRKDFIVQLAYFVKKFHHAGFRHRDLYLCHIFLDADGNFFLIDLARVFKPKLLAKRFLIKDIAQLYYSAPGRYFTKADRMRFYFALTGKNKLNRKDKIFISKVKNKAKAMARHDIRHGRAVPFADKTTNRQ